ncbi:MAG: P1 family peptidase [Alphaproteobacteria bacterium]|nr:P1 family peptidase [Alphaproteobacteria bacterium]
MPRLRDLGFSIGVLPTGPANALTDVPGVRVGHTTLVEGHGALRVGEGPVRTGVTAIHPHEGSVFRDTVPAAIGILNGAGEITGRSQIDEYGLLESPIVLTNTLSVGVAHRATVDWLVANEGMADDFVIPVVAETYDGFLNDIAGQHVREAHVHAALDSATGGPIAEGNVGGGTGMALFQLKGGIGTSSRIVEVGGTAHTVGVLVQGNYGRRHQLRVDGVPVGRYVTDLLPVRNSPEAKEGSIVVVIGTDLPLSDRQLARLARRGMLGIARTGSVAGHGSGDLLLAFSNAPSVRVPRPGPAWDRRVDPWVVAPRLHDVYIDLVFEAVVEATEEAILNALVAAETMVGRDGNTLFGLPHDRLRAAMQRYGTAFR